MASGNSGNVNRDEPLGDAERQRLVAYLDGELSADECQAVEAELAASGAVRVELQQLERVWNALDALPQTAVDDAFTRSTVQLVAADAQREVEKLTATLPARRRWRRWGLVAACLLAMLGGAVLARGLAGRNDRRVLAHLPVLYQYDVLTEFESPEFLRELRRDAGGLIAEFEDAAARQRTVAWREISKGSPAQRAAWIAEQPDVEKIRLQQVVRRYQSASPASRDKARLLHATLLAEPDADDLLATAVAYRAWLATQSAAERSRLRQIDNPQRRVAEARRLFRRDHQRAERTLSDDDLRALRTTIKNLAGSSELEQVKKLWLNRVRRPQQREGEWLRNAVAQRRAEQQRKQIEKNFETFPAGPIRLLAAVAAADTPRLPPPAREALDGWPAIERRLTNALSNNARQTLAEMKNPRRRIEQLSKWVEEAARNAARPDDATLEAFFASDALTDDDRHNLLALPTEKMKQRLRQQYREAEMGAAQFDRNFNRWFGGGRPRGPGGRDSNRRGPRGGGDRQ